jgi:hypothetical protein
MDRFFSPLALCWVLLAAPALAAEPPRVQFDMPFAVACRDVTPPDYSAAHPGRKLVEARLPISALLVSGQEKDLTQFLIRVESPLRTLVVVDYLPKTLSQERLAGPITRQQSTEKTVALGINLSGKYELLSLPGPSAGIGQKKTSSVKYDLLPPLEVVTASGTLDRGRAVFFKLKASPRHLLEGAREYAVVLEVPTHWRLDTLRIRCQADGIRRSVVSSFDEPLICGQRDFLVSLYQSGDEEARRSAEQFALRPPPELQAPQAKQPSHPSEQISSWSLNTPAWDSFRR